MSAHDTCPASIISRLRTRSMPRRTSIRQRASVGAGGGANATLIPRLRNAHLQSTCSKLQRAQPQAHSDLPRGALDMQDGASQIWRIGADLRRAGEDERIRRRERGDGRTCHRLPCERLHISRFHCRPDHCHTGKAVAETQADFNLLGAYPDIDRGIFGYTLDPRRKNPA